MDKAPDAYRTISEVGEDLDLPQHVLRFWETRFSQIKPLKRGGGRRYYRPDDVELLKGIRHLLYKEGYTIKGVQRILKEQGPRAVMAFCQPDLPEDSAPVSFSLPQPVAPPPAYAPPPPLMPAPVFAEPEPEVFQREIAQPEVMPVEAAALPAPAFDELPFALPPLEIAPQAVPLTAPVAGPSQVSMFRGGLQRSEPAPELPLMPPQAPASRPAAPVSYTSSTYMQPAAASPGQARVLLLQALEELSAVRGTLDRLLAARAA
jgi:DNA-binding transcriptional MerR regulator